MFCQICCGGKCNNCLDYVQGHFLNVYHRSHREAVRVDAGRAEFRSISHILRLWLSLGNKSTLVNDKERLWFQLDVLLVTTNIFCNKSHSMFFSTKCCECQTYSQKIKNAVVTKSSDCFARLSILVKTNGYVFSQHFTNMFSINIFVICIHNWTTFPHDVTRKKKEFGYHYVFLKTYLLLNNF